MKLLVSCFEDGLWLVDLSTGTTQQVVDGHCSGLSRWKNELVVGREAGVELFDMTFRSKREFFIRNRADIHDVKVLADSTVVVAETTFNRLSRWTQSGQLVAEWTPTLVGGDMNHLNSILPEPDGMLVSMFRAQNLVESILTGQATDWGTAHHGQIWQLCEGGPKVLWSEQQHPHSLTRVDRQLWWCESFLNKVVREGTEVVNTAPLYPRGLLVTRDAVIVGKSVPRHSEQYAGTAEVGVFTHGTETTKVPLPVREIYDLLPLDS